MCSTRNWTRTFWCMGRCSYPLSHLCAAIIKNTDSLIITVCWVWDGTKLKRKFCHNKDFNKLNLYLFTNHRCRVREGVQGYSDSLRKLLKKESYFLWTMIPCVHVLSLWSQNSCCTSKTQSVSHTGSLGGIKRGVLWSMRRDYFMSLKCNILMENYHIKCSMNFHKPNIILVIITQIKK